VGRRVRVILVHGVLLASHARGETHFALVSRPRKSWQRPGRSHEQFAGLGSAGSLASAHELVVEAPDAKQEPRTPGIRFDITAQAANVNGEGFCSSIPPPRPHILEDSDAAIHHAGDDKRQRTDIRLW
jgi:hypothetical protein